MYGNVSVVRYKKCGWLYIVRPSWINSRTTWSTSWEAAVWSCRRWYQPTSWPTWSKPTHASSPRSTCPTLTSTSRPTCALSASNPPHLLSGLIKSRLITSSWIHSNINLESYLFIKFYVYMLCIFIIKLKLDSNYEHLKNLKNWKIIKI